MFTTKLFAIYLVLLHVLTTARCYQYDCSRSEYNRCVRVADPLVKEARLIFPDNLDDIDLVCRTWNKFVDCLKSYTDKCFSAEQRRQFNKAVENPIESVHQMCMQPHYQKEYLQYAPCIKSTITDRNHCGLQYSLLVGQVEKGEYISRKTLCCSHDRFKQCIMEETRRLCDGGAQNGPASRFSAQILNKALSFLQDQCYNYIPNSGDCGTSTTNIDQFTDPLMIPTSSGEVYPWSTIHDSFSPKDLLPPLLPKSTTSWLPSTSISLDSSSNIDSSDDILGTRTRPASYGRSSSWSESITQNTQPDINTVKIYSETPPTTSSRSEWATVSTWHVLNQAPASGLPGVRASDVSGDKTGLSVGYDRAFTSNVSPSPLTETWYPAAGNQIENEVDEPNQQGLTNNLKNDADVKGKQIFSMTVIATILAFC